MLRFLVPLSVIFVGLACTSPAPRPPVPGEAPERRSEALLADFEGTADTTLCPPLIATLESGTRDARWLRRAGAALLTCGDPERALEAFGEALRLDDRCVTRVWVAVAHLSEGQTAVAEARLRETLRRFPNCTDASLNLSALLRATDRPDEAVQHADGAMRTAPPTRRAEAFESLALSHLATGDVALAGLACDQGLALEPSRASLHNTAGRIALRQRRIPEALQHFERAYTLDPDLVDAWMNHGHVALAHRDFEAAEQLFRQAVQRQPRSYEAHVVRGIALRALDRIDEARSHYEAALIIAPEGMEAMYDLALLLHTHPRDRSDATRARDLLERFLEATSAERDPAMQAARRRAAELLR